MTIIIGIRDKKKVYLGADSCIGGGQSHYVRATGKLFRLGGLIIGLSGYSRIGQLMRYLPTDTFPATLPKSIEAGEAFLVQAFLPVFHKALRDAGAMLRGKEGEDSIQSNAIIAWGNQLFEMGPDFYFARLADDYQAVGAGCDIACGSLFSTKGQPPKQRLRTALEAACHLSTKCVPPFHYMET
jgi:hypothetical protein